MGTVVGTVRPSLPMNASAHALALYIWRKHMLRRLHMAQSYANPEFHRVGRVQSLAATSPAPADRLGRKERWTSLAHRWF